MNEPLELVTHWGHNMKGYGKNYKHCLEIMQLQHLWSSSRSESNVWNCINSSMLLEFECGKLQAKGCPLSIEPLLTTHWGHILRNTYKQCNRYILETRCIPGGIIMNWKTFFQAAQIHGRLTTNSSAVWLRITTQYRALSSLLLAFPHGHKQPFLRSRLKSYRSCS